MILHVFEHLLSCRSCDNAVLIEDPSATRSTVAAATAGGLVGLVIRHGTRESPGSVSTLEIFPFGADASTTETPPRRGPEEPSAVSRQVLCMEDCVTPESRRKISRLWGLRWLSFEQHFGTIAAWSGAGLGECPCRCHRWAGGAVSVGPGSEGDECISIDTTLALVGQQSDRCLKNHGGLETEQDDTNQPSGGLAEGRGRARSEEVLQTDLYILSWREQCRRASR